MSSGGLIAGLIGGIGGGILTVVFATYVAKAKGAELSRRRTLMLRIAGAINLVLGLSFIIAVTLVPELEKAVILLIAIGIAVLLFGSTLVIFAEVYKTIRELQEKSADESPSDKV